MWLRKCGSVPTHNFEPRPKNTNPHSKIPSAQFCTCSTSPSTLDKGILLEHNVKMATELTVQSERAFQKQPHSKFSLAFCQTRSLVRRDNINSFSLVFLNSKTKIKSGRPGKNGRRWYKDVGLGFRTPKTAIEGNYIGMSGRTRARDVEAVGSSACFHPTHMDRSWSWR